MPPKRDASGRFIASGATIAARARRAERQETRDARIDWFVGDVCGKIEMTMEQRVRMATAHLKDRVVRNVGRPVTKGTGPRGGRTVTDRSKSGEFPKADTTLLMKTIFDDVKRDSEGNWDGYVGTPLDYGLILEVRMNRSFLARTLNEESGRIKQILSGPAT